jgi:hypothetical protein
VEVSGKWIRNQSWLFDSGKGPAGRVRFYGSGTNKKKITAVATGAILSSLGK